MKVDLVPISSWKSRKSCKVSSFDRSFLSLLFGRARLK